MRGFGQPLKGFFDAGARLGTGTDGVKTPRAHGVFVGLRQLPLVGEVGLVERKCRRNRPDLARHRVANLERLVERFPSRAVDDEDQAVRPPYVAGIHVVIAVATFEIPEQQRDRITTHRNLLAIDLHADRREVSWRKNGVDEALHEARLPRRENPNHADFFLDHYRSPGGRGGADTLISNDTLRLIRACCTLSGAGSGREVASASPRTRSARTPAAAKIATTWSTRHCASALFVCSDPVGSVRPTSLSSMSAPCAVTLSSRARYRLTANCRRARSPPNDSDSPGANSTRSAMSADRVESRCEGNRTSGSFSTTAEIPVGRFARRIIP